MRGKKGKEEEETDEDEGRRTHLDLWDQMLLFEALESLAGEGAVGLLLRGEERVKVRLWSFSRHAAILLCQEDRPGRGGSSVEP